MIICIHKKWQIANLGEKYSTKSWFKNASRKLWKDVLYIRNICWMWSILTQLKWLYVIHMLSKCNPMLLSDILYIRKRHPIIINAAKIHRIIVPFSSTQRTYLHNVKDLTQLTSLIREINCTFIGFLLVINGACHVLTNVTVRKGNQFYLN